MATPMRTAVAATALLAGLAQAGTVEVNFVQPERYTDAGHGTDAEAARKTLDQHLQALGLAGLPVEQRLKIDILDIDLAGETRPIAEPVQRCAGAQGPRRLAAHPPALHP